MPAWLAALLAQLSGCALALGVAAAGLSNSGFVLVAVQAIGAAIASRLMRRENWWLLIHLCFAPLLVLALASGIDPRWHLAIFVLLLLVFWGTLGTRVPLYLSGRDAVHAMDALLPARRPLRMLDIGCGTGAMLTPLARAHPDCHFTGIESAPLPWLIARLLAGKAHNLDIQRGDFFAADWSSYDVVYAFLSPHPMEQVEDKAQRELGPHALLISKDFAAPGLIPSVVIELPAGSTLYCYGPGLADNSTD
jgi:SAM-dependent methyltransferase